ncbi:zf-HC2 domain-containing protein [Aquihabitans sp. G128]|nr:zf-HC2 domain-containing protein [Aquihabitans sp. G128]QXC62887.1 zf-HC2 domain-containing protein [Aquihabitans sp. G128]
MRCQSCREALSARLDGEDPGVADAVLDRHLASCAACRAFADGSALVRRRLAVRPAEAVPDLTAPILAAAYADRRQAAAAAARSAASAHWTRWALLGVALTQLALSLPPMLFGHDANAPIHLARELGAWDLALAAALLLVVFRPARALGLVPFAGALALAMLVGAVIDVASGRTAPWAESTHLLELVGLALLWVISRRPADDAPLLDGLRRSRPTLAA